MTQKTKHHLFTTLLAHPELLKVDGGWAVFNVKKNSRRSRRDPETSKAGYGKDEKVK